MKLQTKLILISLVLVTAVIFILSSLFQQMFADTLKEQIGSKALNIAETIASSTTVEEAFDDPHPWETIQPFVEEIRIKTGAEFITVGNKEGIRYSHPNPENIGKKMVGGDNGSALSGKPAVSEAVGTLGPSIRGKAPIQNEQGEIIGLVSVGFLLKDVDAITDQYRKKITIMGGIALLIGSIGSIFIARSVKKAIFGLEPKEIGHLYQEKQAIIETIKEGVIAVNKEGRIRLANPAALDMLGKREDEVVGKRILSVVSDFRIMSVIEAGTPEYDREILIGNEIVVANTIPIIDSGNHVLGAVSSFRNKTELYKTTKELSRVKAYADSLRAQTHEYSNKLYLISGLIQSESYQEALDLIVQESDIQKNLIRFIMREIPDPFIGGLLIGKFNRSSELKVDFEIDHQSSFKDVPDEIDRESIVTILGNLIDNAMDAVLKNHGPKKVTVFMTDLGEDLIIEVEDNGSPIPTNIKERMFERGFTTNEHEGRGYGLDLVQRALNSLHGYITLNEYQEKGKNFTVVIPKLAEGRQMHGFSSFESRAN